MSSEDYTRPAACQALKEAHDKCFFSWYTEKYLKGAKAIECAEEWQAYEACLKKKLPAQILALGLEHQAAGQAAGVKSEAARRQTGTK